ncbi:MAG: hypothetical protein NUV82_01460 [Candidatus Komeilibacteria bacterium]|nr:hypothetical protein [Candidatus Komeilibacteria bacterium]
MSNNIDKILADLYVIDESLRDHESQLKDIIQNILASRPDVDIDRDFEQTLRTELLTRAAEIKKGRQDSKFTINSLLMNKKFLYGIGGAALCALLVVPIMYYSGAANLQPLALDLNPRLVQAAPNAFGALTVAGGPNAQESASFRSSAGGGSGVAMDTAATPVSDGLGGDGRVASDMIVAPDVEIKYSYSGEEVTIDEEQMLVLKRLKNGFNDQQLAGILQRMNFNNLDLGKFSNVQVQNITLVEDRQYGLMLNIDFVEGAVYISENWRQWQAASPVCSDEGCWERNRLQYGDIPADDQLIALSNDFLNQYGIDLSSFGTPEVDNQWKLYYERAEDKTSYYVPEIVSVVYPQLYQGQPVYDESGNKAGVRVNINVRVKRVTGLYGLRSQQYQSSLYDIETDFARIKAIAEKGGRYPIYYYQPNVSEINLELGTPTISYVQVWKYENNESHELMVPAMVFPIIGSTADQPMYRQNVIVPLPKDLLNDFGQDGPIRILPVEPMGGDGSGAIEPAIIEDTEI